MKKMLIMLSVLLCCISCNTPVSDKSIDTRIIEVDQSTDISKAEVGSYFKKVKYIPLETNQNSLINDVNGITLHKNKVFIFDRRQNTVLVFNDSGQFINKVSRIGKGPGEYISLRDFKLDTHSEVMVLLCDRPNKLIILNDGTFTELDLKHYYNSISKVTDNKVYLLTEGFETDFFVHVYNISSGELVNKWQKKKQPTKTYGMVQSMFPKSLSSRDSYFTDPYDNNVYMVSDSGVYPAYHINFPGQSLEDRLNSEEVKIEEVYSFCTENALGGFITNFRELKNHVFFTYGPNNIVLYNINTRKVQQLAPAIEDHLNGGLYLFSFYGHNGNDNYMLNLFSPEILANYRTAPNLDEELKSILTNLKDNDNPVIGVYTVEDN